MLNFLGFNKPKEAPKSSEEYAQNKGHQSEFSKTQKKITSEVQDELVTACKLRNTDLLTLSQVRTELERVFEQKQLEYGSKLANHMDPARISEGHVPQILKMIKSDVFYSTVSRYLEDIGHTVKSFVLGSEMIVFMEVASVAVLTEVEWVCRLQTITAESHSLRMWSKSVENGTHTHKHRL